MRLLLLLNLAATLASLLVGNKFLVSQSYLFYAFQLVTMLPYLIYRARLVKNLFMPSFFALMYYLINLTFGGYLLPRGYGWSFLYPDVVVSIQNYPIIVSYLMLANIVLFVLTCLFLSRLARSGFTRAGAMAPIARRNAVADLLIGGCCLLAVAVLGYYEVYSAFSFQMAILVIHLSNIASRRIWLRYAFYGAYLVIMLAVSFDDKRQIIMVLTLILFVESYYRNLVLDLSPSRALLYIAGMGSFLTLILAASVLRGYGSSGATTIIEAIAFLPQYATSDVFIDGVTDNLELNYNYGSVVTPMEHVLTGKMPWQYGLSIAKVAFLPVPRDVFPDKPDSAMQVFTREFSPEMWSIEGSLPVSNQSEMFVNFGYAGLLALALLWAWFNSLFVSLHRLPRDSFGFLSCLFLIITVFMFARGSGLEMFILYYLFAAPILLVFAFLSGHLRFRWARDSTVMARRR
jgi:hypothetical protein